MTGKPRPKPKLGTNILKDKKAKYLWSGKLKPDLPPLYKDQESWGVWLKDHWLIFAQPEEPIKLVTPYLVKHVVNIGPIGAKVLKMIIANLHEERKSALDNAYSVD